MIDIEIDLSPLPFAHALYRRALRFALTTTLLNFLVERKCTSKTTAKIFGQLGFAATCTPLWRRQFEVHPQMAAAVRWRLAFLTDHVPHQVLVGAVDARPFVTYSNCEGSGPELAFAFCQERVQIESSVHCGPP